MPSSLGLIRWSIRLIGRSESTGAPLTARVAALALLVALGTATAGAQRNRPSTTVSQPTGAASGLATLRSPPVLENVSARAGAWLRRRLPVEALADRTAEAQKVKR